MCSNPCNKCGNCSCTCQSDCTGCLDIYDTGCINYNGDGLNCLDIPKDTDFNDVLNAVNSKLCDLISSSGKVKADAVDSCPNSLIDKLEAGANIIISGTGTGCNKKVKIDAVLGGQIIDQHVKVSPNDQATGYLENKIIGGDCISIQKINIGFDEKLKINVDWNCVLNKLVALSGFCSSVNDCVGTTVVSCPSLSLNSPVVAGGSVTISWVSTATQFNVYFDGVLEPGMPTSSLSFNKTGLADGTHVIQVYALCPGGTANSASTNFIVNTTCPTASGLNVSIAGGTASMTWTAATGPNVSTQDVQYRLQGAASWTTHSNVSSSTTNATITGLALNEIYEFRVVTICSVGGPTGSPIFTTTELTCPTLTLTPSNTSIQYQFSSVGGDVNQYVVELLNNTGTIVLQTKTENAPFASVITNTFTGLTNATNYQIRVTVKAGSFIKVCGVQAISTTTPPSCPPGSGMDVTLS